MKIRSKQGIPTPFPTWGGVAISNHPVFTVVLSQFWILRHPRLRSVLWLARLLTFSMEAALAKNLPRRSRDPNGFTHGRVTVKDKVCP